jgi:hypothetical protein
VGVSHSGFSTNPVDPALVRDALAHSYRGVSIQTGIGGRLLGIVRHLLGYLIGLVVEALNRLGGAGSLVKWAIASALGILLLWGGRTLFRRIGLVGEVRSDADSGSSAVVDWRRRAEEALARGDLLLAVRAYYRQLVQSLTEKGWVPDRPGVTSGDCRRAVRNLAMAPQVEQATRAFDAVVYGRRSPREEDVEAIRSAEVLVAGTRV